MPAKPPRTTTTRNSKTGPERSEGSKIKNPKWVYLFREGNAQMRDLLGGKGAGLAEMTRAKLPVPPGFTITTAACNAYRAAKNKFPKGMWQQTLAALKKIEKASGKKFGDAKNPLLVSVRSGAKFSMPGMMDTVLNLGLNPRTVQGIEALTKNPRFAQDSYRRFIQMFGKTVMGIEGKKFDAIFDAAKAKYRVTQDTDLDSNSLRQVVAKYKELYQKEIGADFPDDPYQQLELAIGAVFRSWMGKRAIEYRRIEKIPEDLGTAVNVMPMVFGNLGNDSGTGVAFTRNSSTGANELTGEFLLNAQGEDVVAGVRTPLQIAEMKARMPKLYAQLGAIARRMEKHYRDMQDVEFTIERGKLYMLQTRTAKRTARAAIKIAVDLAREKVITKEEAVQRVDAKQVEILLSPQFDERAKEAARKSGAFLTHGLNASPGAASGVAVFDPDKAVELSRANRHVILVRYETSQEDVHGMFVARGILTQHGGATSHAAVVARGWNKPCVAGCEAIRVEEDARKFSVNGQVIQEGDTISIDGGTGEVFAGEIKTNPADFENEADLKLLLSWADVVRAKKSRRAIPLSPAAGLEIWANADYPADARVARRFGAQGIGLCRTEHMFKEAERLPIVRSMILAKEDATRQKYLDQLLPIQRNDFIGLFEAMGELPVVIRLIDPPLHEFLPPFEALLVQVTELRVRGNNPAELAEKEELLSAVTAMREANPMLGLRGCRLGITMPQITMMQVRAIIEAACAMRKRGVHAHPEIMIPLIGHVNELTNQRAILEAEAKKVMAEQGVTVDYKFGTMIELPRAALTSAEIAPYAQFYSFGTNDLTQMAYGFSRDDAEGKFLLQYVEDKILPENPFQSLDWIGVGRLMEICVQEGRAVRPDLKIGICGEHGGDPSSIEFCHRAGLNYVSASPYRVPVARLAAAQAALAKITKDK